MVRRKQQKSGRVKALAAGDALYYQRWISLGGVAGWIAHRLVSHNGRMGHVVSIEKPIL